MSAAKQSTAVWPGPVVRELNADEKPPSNDGWQYYYCGEPEDKMGTARQPRRR